VWCLLLFHCCVLVLKIQKSLWTTSCFCCGTSLTLVCHCSCHDIAFLSLEGNHVQVTVLSSGSQQSSSLSCSDCLVTQVGNVAAVLFLCKQFDWLQSDGYGVLNQDPSTPLVKPNWDTRHRQAQNPQQKLSTCAPVQIYGRVPTTMTTTQTTAFGVLPIHQKRTIDRNRHN
jgi:hypothetical protein